MLTDESCFPAREATVRRTEAEFRWIASTLEANSGHPVSNALPDVSEDEESLQALSKFFTSIARDPDLKEDDVLRRFLFEDKPLVPEGRLPTFVCDLQVHDRGDLASLPLSYLHAMAEHLGASLRGCATPFEFADRILAKAAGLNEEEVVPASVAAGPVEDEDLFDSLASTRAATGRRGPPGKLKPRVSVSSETDKASGTKTTTETAISLLPVTVSAWLSVLELDKHVTTFKDGGYDDLRVVTNLKASDHEAMGIPAVEMDVLLRSGFEWQMRAKQADLIDHWSRAQHRADEHGFVEVETTTVFEQEQGAERMSVKRRTSVVTLRGVRPSGGGAGGGSGARPSGPSQLDEEEKQLRVEGNFLVDQYGNIDFKAGDEAVNLDRFAHVQEWDPSPVLRALYDNRRPERLDQSADAGEEANAFGPKVVRIEGYLEKLPKGKERSGMLTRWHRRYFKACDGELAYYDDDKATRASGAIRLRGSEISFKGGNLLEVFDPRKKSRMVLRAGSTQELEDWKLALDEEAATLRRRVVRDATRAHELRNTLIFDVGSCSVRAGFAEPSGLAWPSLYEPACVARPKTADRGFFCGSAALVPKVRALSSLHYPLATATSFSDTMDVELLEILYGDLFRQLGVDSSERTVILTEPQFASDRERSKIAEIMFETYNVPSLYMKHQALLSMFSYGATTGVIVDIGDRMDIIPLDSGYVIDKGITSMRLGGKQVTESLTRMMTEAGHRFFSPVEAYVGRYVKERLAYVARDFDDALRQEERGLAESGHVDVRRFAVPDESKTFTLAGPRFRCTEGLFQPLLWGKVRLGTPRQPPSPVPGSFPRSLGGKKAPPVVFHMAWWLLVGLVFSLVDCCRIRLGYTSLFTKRSWRLPWTCARP